MTHRRAAELYRNALHRLRRRGSPQFRLVECQIELMLIQDEDLADRATHDAHARILRSRWKWGRLDDVAAEHLIADIAHVARRLRRLVAAEASGASLGERRYRESGASPCAAVAHVRGRADRP